MSDENHLACRDCRHVDDHDMKRIICRHPQSAVELLDPYYGTMKTVRHAIDTMRTIGPCGPEAKLFEPWWSAPQ